MQEVFPEVPEGTFVSRANGLIRGYAVVTHRGLIRNSNEDRVSIIMSITKRRESWPACTYFGVFDGHGGSTCSDFLKDNLHRYITDNAYFPQEPVRALAYGFQRAQKQFLRLAVATKDRSGSCALVLLIIGDVCYVGNLGDSRAILSLDGGRETIAVSQDHKPELEKDRIEEAGGSVYQSCGRNGRGEEVVGPYRIVPGKLSVSRAFGDIEAKLGNPGVLIARPQITSFCINGLKHDFIVVCSDGVYDRMSNREVTECFWEQEQGEGYGFVGDVPGRIVRRAMEKYSSDNLTALVVVIGGRERNKQNVENNREIVKGKSILGKNNLVKEEPKRRLVSSRSTPMINWKSFGSKGGKGREGLRG